MPPVRSKPELSLYIHFPWCVRKCPYCDFNSHGLRGEVPETKYIEALLRDLDHDLAGGETRALRSIFMGGGTPSLFSGTAIAGLLEQVNRRIAFAPDIEITLEANPGTADADNFRDYRAGGVNRLSIGVQSLNAAQLKALGRIHDPGEAISAYRKAREAGIANINLDLMFALPKQTVDEALEDLRGVMALQPEHVSWYQLTLEPNTEFAARPPALPDDETAWAMQEQGQDLLANAGYAQYEISAYAQPGRRAAHNLNYWRFGDYLGIGAGAHGKLTREGGIERRAKHKHPKTYLQSAGGEQGIQEQRGIEPGELPFEFCMNALRLREGFTLEHFNAATGLAPSALEPALSRARALGLLDTADGIIRASELGWRHLNRLTALFL